jgi:hypothetical protein
MDELQFDDLEFPLGWCGHCQREVLTAVGDESDARHCVHCGEPIGGPIRHARGMDLADSGYALHEEQGCGRPDCGGGRCGSRS